MNSQLETPPAISAGAKQGTEIARPSNSEPVHAPTGSIFQSTRSTKSTLSTHDERVQHLIAATAILNEEIQHELRALSHLLTADEFCTAACAIQKQLAPLTQFLLGAQLALRLGQRL